MTKETDSGTGERATFIVRLWRRSSTESWHGQLEHVQSGERRALPSMRAAFIAVRAWLQEQNRQT